VTHLDSRSISSPIADFSHFFGDNSFSILHAVLFISVDDAVKVVASTGSGHLVRLAELLG
jgi:hypothetical protein